jgi:putative ABC transport system permease protein
MNRRRFVIKSLVYHLRSHLGALLGAAVGTAVLTGALLVGDSVRESLRQMGLVRLGQVELALPANDRFFREALVAEISEEWPVHSAPVLQVLGTAARADGSARANRVQVLGVDQRFWNLAQDPVEFDLPLGSVALSRSLAGQLNATAGETLVLRVQKPSQLSRDAPLSPEEDFSIALRLEVRAILSDEQFGRFSLQANQVPPFNAFVSLPQLQQRLDLPGRANLMLLAPGEAGPLDLARASELLKNHFSLEDAELDLITVAEGGQIELRSSRVFLDEAISEAALAASPDARGVLTYFVNQLELGERATPYSMVAAMNEPVVPADVQDDEMLINQWLAEDLNASAGDEIITRYYVVGLGRQLEEKEERFTVRAVLPMEPPALDPLLMPDFPGLADAESCRDWDTGFPIDLDAIREKDEQYWNDFRGTPKAFVTLPAGQRMWSNRFGSLTAVRYPAELQTNQVASAILNHLDPAATGLSFQPVRAQALAASHEAQDFGQLFIGFSFFLIVSALLLMALLFQFGLEQRSSESGILLAAGFPPAQVRRLLVWEGGGVALAGSLLGLAGGIVYARAMLYGLSTIWQEAVGASGLIFHASVPTLLTGLVAGALVAWGTIFLSVRKQARQPARELLAEGHLESLSTSGPARGAAAWILAGATCGAALILVGLGLARSESVGPGLFFGAGALLLVAGIALASGVLARLQGRLAEAPTLSGLGVRNATRRRKRSLAIIGLLASGSFLVMAIGAFRLDADADATERSSGTGGFAFLGETSMAVAHDLNQEGGREFFGLDERKMAEVRFVPLRLREGEDASCLNLNRAQRPRLAGVMPELLAERQAFTFARVAKGLPADQPWSLLHHHFEDGAVPAIGDDASIQWALGLKVGDSMSFTNDRGQTFAIRLVASVANSILQGTLLVSEANFIRQFPNESGYRMFLVDAPFERMEEVSATLSRGLQDVGFELTPAARRLAQFNAVQNTYLSTFQVLGGLGLLLGSAGIGVVVLRNVFERRGELALLSAVGFRSRGLKWLVMSEHGMLLATGLLLGMGAALVAVLPALMAPGSDLPFFSLGITLALILLFGALWTWLATALALRGRLLEALRDN